MTKRITIMDTFVASFNAGDAIISEAVKKEITGLFPAGYQIVTVPTHEYLSRYGRNIVNSSEFSFLAGTNILQSRSYLPLLQKNWKVGLRDYFKMKNVVLVGVGWQGYQKKASIVNKIFYQRVFDSSINHSVRDSYTEHQLNNIGIYNVVNTGDPTLWQMTPDHCSAIPRTKSRRVITTITDYSRNSRADEKMLSVLKKNYDDVSIWLQGSEDEKYFETFPEKVKLGIKKIPGILHYYDKFLTENEDLDYVGTRLHAGIRAMQKKKRTIIIGIDNRANEMKKDFGIKVLKREDVDSLDNWINEAFSTKVNLDFDLINVWRGQFLPENEQYASK